MSAPGPNPAIRVILLPRDTNDKGTIFGGILLSYIDLAGAVGAREANPNRIYVTVALNGVEFHQPVFVGDLVSFYARPIEVGRTSIRVKVDVFAARRAVSGREVKVTEAEVVYVAVDQNQQPVPVLDE